MHLPRLITDLGAIARGVDECTLVRTLAAGWRTIQPEPRTARARSGPGRSTRELELRAAALLAQHATAIRSLPWHLPDSVLWELPRVAGVWSWQQALQALLRRGAGLTAASGAVGGGCWLPCWLLNEAARRTPLPPPLLPRRWALPSRYPLPLEQALLGPHAQELLHALPGQGGRGLEPARELPDAHLPADYLVARPTPSGPLPGRKQLLRLVKSHPAAGLRALLRYGPTPLHALWGELVRPVLARSGVPALPSEPAPAAPARAWDGRVGTCWLRRREGGVVTSPGWLAAAAASIGWRCAGLPVSATMPAELALLGDAGGRLLTTEDGGGQLLPPSVGTWLLALLPGMPSGP